MSQPRRIALVAACPFPSPQGSQVFVGQMAEELAGRGHDVHLLTYGQGHEVFGRGFKHHRISRLPGDDASRSGPSLVKPLLDLLLARRLSELVREERIQIVHAHNYEAAVAALIARSRTKAPVVYHSHNLFGDELPSYFEAAASKRLAAWGGRQIDATVPRRCDRVVALCSWSAARLAESGVSSRRLSVVPPAILDDGVFEDASSARAALGLPVKGFIVGYAGNLDGYQNLGVLLDGFQQMTSDGAADAVPVPLLLIATHGSDSSLLTQLKTLGSRAKLVRVEGYAQTRRMMAACDVLALPRREGSGFPIKLLNYMSGSRAVVTGGCGAKVLTPGVDGITVPDGDPGALSAALNDLRFSPERVRELAENARRTYLRRLTWGVVTPQIEAIYDSLLGEPGEGLATTSRTADVHDGSAS